jgi:hypothetical protein
MTTPQIFTSTAVAAVGEYVLTLVAPQDAGSETEQRSPASTGVHA